jgi:fructose-1,6-bisphosphatase/inositol monophosphatase family enzyme
LKHSLLDCERIALHRFATNQPIDDIGQSPEPSAVVSLMLRCAIEAASIAREAKLQQQVPVTKADLSPVTIVDQRIEECLRKNIEASGMSIAFVGEESGGSLDVNGSSIAVDPIDGTWAFINRGSNFSTSLALFRGTEVEVAVVVNPSTGELLYSSGSASRLLQLGLAGTTSSSTPLPLACKLNPKTLLHIHPARQVQPLVSAAMSAWRGPHVQLVTMGGGSPAWALAECAKGQLTYVNLWPAAQTNPYDLAAGVEIVRCAGGDVTGLDGNPIDCLTHRGVFVAAVSVASRERIVALARDSSVTI